LEAHPVIVLAAGIVVLAVFLYRHPVVFLVLAVVGVVIYLVLSIASVGTKKKTELINKSADQQFLLPVELPLISIDKNARLP
ncbi:MAG: hypothetical protein PVJ36_08460, partial [Nitrospirota bacterium]